MIRTRENCSSIHISANTYLVSKCDTIPTQYSMHRWAVFRQILPTGNFISIYPIFNLRMAPPTSDKNSLTRTAGVRQQFTAQFIFSSIHVGYNVSRRHRLLLAAPTYFNSDFFLARILSLLMSTFVYFISLLEYIFLFVSPLQFPWERKNVHLK